MTIRTRRRALAKRFMAYGTLLLTQVRPVWAELPAPCGGSACTAAGGPATWISAGNVQTPVISGGKMTIQQLSGSATLNWQKFNISADGSVEFVARSKLGGRAHRLHETSRFVREDGEWFYVDGDLKN